MSRSTSKSEATVTIQYRDRKTAESVLKAVEPDNLVIPEGISLDSSVTGDTLTVQVECARGVGSLVATLDDLLSCIQAAENALGEIT